MSQLTVGTTIHLVASTVAVNILNGSDRLNSFVNWISSARINRDKLAQNVWLQAKDLIGEKVGKKAIDKNMLGDNSAHLVSLLKTLLVTGDREEIKLSIAALVTEGSAHLIGESRGELQARLVEIVQSVATTLATRTVENELGEDIADKVLATMLKQNGGWNNLEAAMEKAIGPRLGRDFIIRQIHGVLSTALANKDQTGSAAYIALASIANTALKGGDDKDKVRAEMLAHVYTYAPKSFTAISAAIDGAKRAASAAQHVKNLAASMPDSVQNTLTGTQKTIGDMGAKVVNFGSQVVAAAWNTVGVPQVVSDTWGQFAGQFNRFVQIKASYY